MPWSNHMAIWDLDEWWYDDWLQLEEQVNKANIFEKCLWESKKMIYNLQVDVQESILQDVEI